MCSCMFAYCSSATVLSPVGDSPVGLTPVTIQLCFHLDMNQVFHSELSCGLDSLC